MANPTMSTNTTVIDLSHKSNSGFKLSDVNFTVAFGLLESDFPEWFGHFEAFQV